MKNTEVRFEKVCKIHQKFITEMLYHAIYIPEGEQPPEHGIVESDQLKKYHEDIGKDTDLGYIAIDNKTNTFIGAIWLRLFAESKNSWGFVNDETPELSMAIVKEYRGLGIGTELLEYMLINSMDIYPSISLSVDPSNYAIELYERYGFKEVGEKEGSKIMILDRH